MFVNQHIINNHFGSHKKNKSVFLSNELKVIETLIRDVLSSPDSKRPHFTDTDKLVYIKRFSFPVGQNHNGSLEYYRVLVVKRISNSYVVTAYPV